MGSSSFRAYGKYVRVNVTSATGSGSGQVVTYGYKGTSASAGLGGGGDSGGSITINGVECTIGSTCTVAAGINGGVVAYAADHTLSISDCGNYLVFNGSSLTFTLSSPPPASVCPLTVQNVAASSLTVARNGLTINGASSNLTLGAISGVTALSTVIRTDGINYYASTVQ